MSYRDSRTYISLGEAIERVAQWHFNGDRDKALHDILAALQDGALRARGVNWTTDETGMSWPENLTGKPEQISPQQWRIFDFDADKIQLHYEISDYIADRRQKNWVEDIEVKRTAVCKLWPPPLINTDTVMWDEVKSMKRRGEALKPRTKLAERLSEFLLEKHGVELAAGTIRNKLSEIWEHKDLV